MHTNIQANLGRIHIPAEWPDGDLLTFEQGCKVLDRPQNTVRDWRRRGVGPKWFKIPGTGGLYTTVGDLRRFLNTRTPITGGHR